VSEGPAAEVVAAFGGDPASLVRLEGGAGTTWRAGDVVLKPGDDAAYIAWLSRLTEALVSDDFRIPRPRASAEGDWVVDGWWAMDWLSGRHTPGTWERDLEVCDVFHAAVARSGVPITDAVTALSNPWRQGDAVAWGEHARDAAWPASVHDMLDRLATHLANPWSGPPAQPVHLDIGGNILYADGEGLPPAVIDLSIHVRPAPYAKAVLVSDAAAWSGAPLSLVIGFLAREDHADELVARAVAFRVATAALLWSRLRERVDAEVDGYRAVVSLLAR